MTRLKGGVRLSGRFLRPLGPELGGQEVLQPGERGVKVHKRALGGAVSLALSPPTGQNGVTNRAAGPGV